jgi:hypothetical protein
MSTRTRTTVVKPHRLTERLRPRYSRADLLHNSVELDATRTAALLLSLERGDYVLRVWRSYLNDSVSSTTST